MLRGASLRASAATRTCSASAEVRQPSLPAPAGGEGSYPGRTLEGIETTSLYRMSPVTNWSVHIGIPRELYNEPLRRSLWLTIGAAAISATLATIFALLLGREIRSRRAEEVALERS